VRVRFGTRVRVGTARARAGRARVRVGRARVRVGKAWARTGTVSVRFGRARVRVGIARFLVGKRTTGETQVRWQDNIMMDLQEVGCGGIDWFGLAQDRDRWRVIVNAVMNRRVP
jgi:hypothetical protein